jgi:PhnB protein
MARDVRYIPEGFHTATPYLIVRNAAAALEFYKRVRRRGADAPRRSERQDPPRRVRVGDSPIMLTDEWSEFPEWQSPQARGGSPVHIYLYVEDADALFRQAIEAGAKQLLPMQDQVYGDRSGGVTDPFGHVWYIATRIKNLSEEEMQRRVAAPARRDGRQRPLRGILCPMAAVRVIEKV